MEKKEVLFFFLFFMKANIGLPLFFNKSGKTKKKKNKKNEKKKNRKNEKKRKK